MNGVVGTVNLHVKADTPIDASGSESGQYMRIGDWITDSSVVVIGPSASDLITFFARCHGALVAAREARNDLANLNGFLTNDADPEEDLVSSLVDGEEVTDE